MDDFNPDLALEKFDPLTADQSKLIAALRQAGIGDIPPKALTPPVETVIRSLFSRWKFVAEQGGVDPLTGLKNRHFFEEYFASEVMKRKDFPWEQKSFRKTDTANVAALTPPKSATLVSIDFNFLKALNDDSGLESRGGDIALKDFAEFLESKFIRQGDIVARTGGDEFWLILPNTLPAAAKERLQQLRREFRNRKFDAVVNGTQAELFTITRENVRAGKSAIGVTDPRYTSPADADQIVPSFAFGCVAIDLNTCPKDQPTESIMTELKKEADDAMKKDKKAWKLWNAAEVAKTRPVLSTEQLEARTKARRVYRPHPDEKPAVNDSTH